jgi:hypothetical protein
LLPNLRMVPLGIFHVLLIVVSLLMKMSRAFASEMERAEMISKIRVQTFIDAG